VIFNGRNYNLGELKEKKTKWGFKYFFGLDEFVVEGEDA